jgi:hypothetical protein
VPRFSISGNQARLGIHAGNRPGFGALFSSLLVWSRRRLIRHHLFRYALHDVLGALGAELPDLEDFRVPLYQLAVNGVNRGCDLHDPLVDDVAVA